ncbi:autotransporter outer membrane beta-barrel domain-containing protein, partial [Campylobacter jejuni]
MTIQSSGTIQAPGNQYAILLVGEKSNTPTLENFNNEGFIKGKIGIENDNGNFTGTITVKTFENKGTIKGYIGIGSGDGTMTVKTFDNKKTIDGDIYMATRNGGTMSIENF